MYENTNAHNNDDDSMQFQYDDQTLEVVIIENGDDDRDGYIELTAAAKLLAPLVTIRGFSHAVLWANVISSQRLTRNNKHYVHVFALGRYLSAYKLSTHNKRQVQAVKQLICDLIIGAQSHLVDPLIDIKTQLCTLQECLAGNNQLSNTTDNVMYQAPQPPLPSQQASYESLNNTEVWRDILRSEHAALFANIGGALETIKSMQADLTNKIAFSNDTMLDGFKSIKDMMRKK
nr:p24 [Mamestra configurata nucleopolyhedrovirus A]WRQ96417.1 p24 [Mamestra configurata nucleopolyhedrovirus A]